MKVRFLKDHPSGLVKGQVKEIRSSYVKNLIKNGLAEEVKATKPKQTRTKKED